MVNRHMITLSRQVWTAACQGRQLRAIEGTSPQYPARCRIRDMETLSDDQGGPDVVGELAGGDE